jgi:GT2 family glycosyltransferase
MTNQGNSQWPTVFFSILNWNQKDLTAECLELLIQLGYPNYTIVVVDNGSRDGEAAELQRRFSTVTVLENGRNLGFAEENNVVIRYALKRGADHFILLNNDIEEYLGQVVQLAPASVTG